MADVHHTPTDCHINIPQFNDDAKISITLQEVTCVRCNDVLLDPTTLSCGHSFCSHCLTTWVQYRRQTACPTCHRISDSFPKVNISFRDLVEKHFPADVARRRSSITNEPRIGQSLQLLPQTQHLIPNRVAPPPVRLWYPWLGPGGLISGVLLTVTISAVVFLVYHWRTGDLKLERLVKKPLGAWTPEEVVMWMENLGTWTSPYRDIFIKEQVNGRLLNSLEEQDLLKPPYGIENELHRRTLMKEVQHVQELGFKRPQNLWEYKAVNGGKSLFLLYTLTDSPRLSILYMYFFDYDDSFLPFIHISCPSAQEKSSGDDLSFRNLDSPDWRQWLWFVMLSCFLPYELIYIFASDWQEVHYWTSRFIMWHCFILTLREGQILWSLRRDFNLRLFLVMGVLQLCAVAGPCVTGLLLWNVLPLFVWNSVFYWGLYFIPMNNVVTFLCPYVRQQFPNIYDQL